MVMDNDVAQEPVQEELSGSSDITEEWQDISEPDINETPDTETPEPIQQVAPQQVQPVQEPVPSQQDAQELTARRMAEAQELQIRRGEEQNRQWRDRVGTEARDYQKQLMEKGYLPEHAQDQAKRFIQSRHQQNVSEQRTDMALKETEGRHLATIHYMKLHGLIDEETANIYTSLQQTMDTDQMEKEVQRIKRDRDTQSELTTLRQGRVSPQTFDSSQGSTEASTSDGRLASAYRDGDRSPAAVEAARRMTFGS
jgi:hypothetical protein